MNVSIQHRYISKGFTKKTWKVKSMRTLIIDSGFVYRTVSYVSMIDISDMTWCLPILEN